MNKTGIDWCDRTWNPLTGCYGPGGTKEEPRRCTYCYARTVAEMRTKAFPQGFKPVFHEKRLELPGKVKDPQTVFVGSMTDMMGDWWDDHDINAVIEACYLEKRHTFLWLTKRPGRYASFIWPDNCWLGTTVTGDKDLGRIEALLLVKDVKRFLSIEPMLGGVALNLCVGLKDGNCHFLENGYCQFEGYGVCKGKDERACEHSVLHNIHQVILGGETGTDARPMHPDWVRSVRDQCEAAGVPFFLKSWGEWKTRDGDGLSVPEPVKVERWGCLNKAGEYVPGSVGYWNGLNEEHNPGYVTIEKVGKKAAGRLLDGREHNDLAWRMP